MRKIGNQVGYDYLSFRKNVFTSDGAKKDFILEEKPTSKNHLAIYIMRNLKKVRLAPDEYDVDLNTGKVTLTDAPDTGDNSVEVVHLDKRGTVVEAGNIYDICAFTPNRLGKNDILLRFAVSRPIKLLKDFPGSKAVASTGATTAVDLSVRKNGFEFGKVSFKSGLTDAILSSNADMSFAEGDVITVITPNTVDPTLDELALTFEATLL